ncbi:ubiquinone/menaquinone biosynthesis methyltransferase [Desulfonatronum thiodismutans]|uniref:ubiquinone/menaquinone biosynthesis methyltransferase n=1 Tax=Desulfonatronum thiodismutans TaxID=159290 RepID=UPI0004ABE829|nr:ubiquinone/menaquinone biosynthesis methyltransferase [Desulfonatronum thiodismutans]
MNPNQKDDHKDHGRRVVGLFGRIAPWYDFLNHFLSLGCDVVWRKRLRRCVRVHRANRVLDLAAGTLDVSREIVRHMPNVDVVAMDFSEPMLRRGQRKIRGKGDERGMPSRPRIQPVVADGRALPARDECVDCVTIAFGIRNIRPREAAYREVLRVLTPGGRFCILEFGAGRQKILRGFYNLYLHRVLPLIGRIFSGDPQAYRYLAESIQEFPDAGTLCGELLQAGFARAYSVPMTFGIVQLHIAEKAGTGHGA